MTRSTAVKVPELRRKIDMAKGMWGYRLDEQFGEAASISKGSLSDYFSGKFWEIDHIPEAPLRRLAKLMAKHSNGRLTDVQARQAWQGSLSQFARSLVPLPINLFGDLLTRTAPSFDISLVINTGRLGMVEDPPEFIGPEVQRIPTDTRFWISAEGEPGWHFIVFVLSSAGWQCAVPRNGVVPLFPTTGELRAPLDGLEFKITGHRHFYAFAIKSSAAPFLPSLGTRTLMEADLAAFAEQLENPILTEAFKVATQEVYADQDIA